MNANKYVTIVVVTIAVTMLIVGSTVNDVI